MQAWARNPCALEGPSYFAPHSVLKGPGGSAVRLESSRALLLHTRCKGLCPAVVFSFAIAIHAAPSNREALWLKKNHPGKLLGIRSESRANREAVLLTGGVLNALFCLLYTLCGILGNNVGPMASGLDAGFRSVSDLLPSVLDDMSGRGCGLIRIVRNGLRCCPSHAESQHGWNSCNSM